MKPFKRTERWRLIQLPKLTDLRGNLTFIESNKHISFDIKRVFYQYDIPDGAVRGGHAHKTLQQLMIAMSGSFDIVMDDGHREATIRLNKPWQGLYIPEMIWCEIRGFSSGSVCMVLASAPYNESEYYRDYDAFLQAMSGEA